MLNLIEVILIATGVATWVFILMCLCGLISFSAGVERK